jgi:hypothetical protein
MFNLDISPEPRVFIESMVNKSENGCDPMERCKDPYQNLPGGGAYPILTIAKKKAREEASVNF